MLTNAAVRAELAALTPLEAAPRLLGARLRALSDEGAVTLRIVEVEAYWGSHDPGSHGWRGKTKRNAVMFGEAGHLYAYLTYGMHICINIVTSAVDECAGVLLRGAEVIEGADLARERRAAVRRADARPLRDHELARGPANLARAVGATLADNGADLCAAGPLQLELPDAREHEQLLPRIRRSLRTGVAVPGGAEPFDWRWWLDGEAAVSPYQAHRTVRELAQHRP